MYYLPPFRPKEWVRLLSELDEPISACARVQFLFYMRRNCSKPRRKLSTELTNLWARQEGMEIKRVVCRTR